VAVELRWYFVTVQSKDEEKSSQKSVPESSTVVDDLETVADKEEPNASSGLEVSTNRSGTTSERRVTRASARSQQQRGRSSADCMLHMLCVTVADAVAMHSVCAL